MNSLGKEDYKEGIIEKKGNIWKLVSIFSLFQLFFSLKEIINKKLPQYICKILYTFNFVVILSNFIRIMTKQLYKK